MINDPQLLNVGVAGVGYLGQHHARIYSELPHCELVGIFEPNRRRAKEISSLYNCRCFDSIEALGEACNGVSVVVPTDKHLEVALPLLAQGCHLLIEKPLCKNSVEAEQIVTAAKTHNCFVQVGHIEHFNPVMNFLEEVVVDPRFITADRLAPFNRRGTEVGVATDLMIHDIGIILKLVKSPIKKIEAVGVNILTETEDIANARISFENGCVANLNSSRVSQKKLREIRIFQPNAYLSLDFMNQKGHLIKKRRFTLKKEKIPIEKAEPLKLELQAFLNTISHRIQPKVGADFGKSALEVAIHISEQIKEGT